MEQEKIEPDFIGLGAMRCGSTWLSRVLDSHPDLFVPTAMKEVHFFDEFYADKISRVEKGRWNYEKGISWYENILAEGRGLVKGEITPNYFYDSGSSSLIKEHYPEVKLILSLRNPVERCLSHINYVKLNYPGLEIPLNLSGLRNLDAQYGFLSFGNYSGFLKNYFDAFPRNQFLIINYRSISDRPLIVCKSIYQFLGVKSGFKPDGLEERVNSSNRRKSPLLFSIMRKVKKGVKGNRLLVKYAGKLGLVSVFREVGKINTRSHETSLEEESLRAELQDYYADELKSLSNFVCDV